MLEGIAIRHYTLINELNIEFDSALNVITGETGAGKSIVIDALTMILGQRGNKNNIELGYDRMTVQGVFDIAGNTGLINHLNDMGIEPEENRLILTRTIDKNGRNRCKACGINVTVSELKTIGESLVDIHSQHENNALFEPETQRRLVDAAGGKPTAALLAKASEQAATLKTMAREIREAEKESADLDNKKTIAKHLLSRITEVDPKPNEDIALEKERVILENSEKMFLALAKAEHAFHGDETESGGVLSAIDEIDRAVDTVAAFDDDFVQIKHDLTSASEILYDVSVRLADYAENLAFNPGRLEVVESRLSMIDELKRRFGGSIETVLSEKERLETELERLNSHEDTLLKQKKNYKKVWDSYKKTAKALHDARVEDAKKLKKAIEAELADLAMPKAKLNIHVDFDERLISPHGSDRIQFTIATNPGAAEGSLKKVASGGELSRIMLALKCVFAEKMPKDTLIFDEIDTGISGRTAQTVAEKISRLGQKRQVICITHLPQITAMADEHFRVSKKADDAHTTVSFDKLDEQESLLELSRMLSGAEITETSLNHAKEMIAQSKSIKHFKEPQ